MLLIICFNWFIFYYLEIKLVPAHFAFCVLMLTNYERVKKYDKEVKSYRK